MRYAIRAASGIDIGSNTDAQLRNRKNGVIVDTSSDGYPNEQNLQAGDCLYFKGNSSHIMNVGHVEMYTAAGELYGHGSGAGPKRHDLKDYCRSRIKSGKPYFMAIRWIPDDASDGSTQQNAERRTLKRNMQGADVAELQTRLISLGYSCGRWGADGEYGRATEAAVRAFQTDCKLKTDGIVGKNTWAALLAREPGDSEKEEKQPENPIELQPGSWHLRTGPGADYSVAGVVHDGEALARVKMDGWIPVIYKGEVRYISERAVKEK